MWWWRARVSKNIVSNYRFHVCMYVRFCFLVCVFSVCTTNSRFPVSMCVLSSFRMWSIRPVPWMLHRGTESEDGIECIEANRSDSCGSRKYSDFQIFFFLSLEVYPIQRAYPLFRRKEDPPSPFPRHVTSPFYLFHARVYACSHAVGSF